VYIEDLREEFVKEYVFWAVKVRKSYVIVCSRPTPLLFLF
jgi:argininosuccinate synthase